jgi:hypothetical protein
VKLWYEEQLIVTMTGMTDLQVVPVIIVASKHSTASKLPVGRPMAGTF